MGKDFDWAEWSAVLDADVEAWREELTKNHPRFGGFLAFNLKKAPNYRSLSEAVRSLSLEYEGDAVGIAFFEDLAGRVETQLAEYRVLAEQAIEAGSVTLELYSAIFEKAAFLEAVYQRLEREHS